MAHTCETCKHFIGGGDWNVCCDLMYDLCYKHTLACEKYEEKFKEGQLIVYRNGNTYEIGKIKRIVDDGAFVWYSCGETAAKTPFDLMHPLVNEYVIGETGLGGCMN